MIGLLAAGCVLVVTATVSTTTPLEGGRSFATNTTTTSALDETDAKTPGLPPRRKPLAADFKLGIKILEKQCFGSAGCNITFRVSVVHEAPPLDPDLDYELTYRIDGAEDPYVNTLSIRGNQSSADEEESVSTRSRSVTLKAVVTSLEQV